MTPSRRVGRWLPDALGRGFVAFLVVAAAGQFLALAVWAVGDTGASLGAFARVGWMYVGAFHHVAVELDVPDLDAAAAGAPDATSLSVGVALLAVTALAAVLLFHAGRAVADRAGGGTLRRVGCGVTVAPSYAIALFVVASIVEVRTPLRLGAFASGELHVALSSWQSLAFPLAIAAAAGAAGGFRSALDAHPADDRALARAGAAAAGGTRMFVLGLALSLAGLFAAGVVRPDGPEALLTPSTARYARAVFDRPAAGLVLLGHHLALLPNEAVWTLVPAMGGCVAVRGSSSGDVLCYRRFPTAVGTTTQQLTEGAAVRLPLGSATYGTAPAAYLLFLLAPALATVLGGRRAARRLGSAGTAGAIAGATAGVVFAALVAVAALLAGVSVDYGAAFGEGASGGSVVVGPGVVAGALLALAWGTAGGALGGWTAGRGVRTRSSGTS
ncbi:MAG: hypothetical protein ACXWXP_07450 [Actinomycetota bacterium]